MWNTKEKKNGETGIKMPLSKEKLEELLIKSENPIKDAVKYYEENCIMPESYARDPRNGAITIFCPNRCKRPDNYNGNEIKPRGDQKSCPICEGNTSPVLMTKPLPSGAYAFINENIYPFLNPEGTPNNKDTPSISGINLLLWPTNEHKDIQEMSPEDHAVSFEMLGELESILKNKHKHVQIIKNTGKAVGGSIEHGHYQIAGLSFYPKKIEEDILFLNEGGISFAQYMLNQTPQELKIKEYSSAVVLTPYFMRRPLDALIIPKNPLLDSVRKMDKQQILDFARATSDIASALSNIMPRMKKEFAYNFVFHTGPLGTMYIEVLPYTQEEGGFEKSGLNVCQSSPEISTELYKPYFRN